jgi:FdhD protein
MGRDKRWIEIDGIPLLQRAIAAVAALAGTADVVVADPTDRVLVTSALPDTRVHTDRRPGEGPLAGLETALAGEVGDVVVVLAGDHPYVEPAVLRSLVDRLTQHPELDAAVLGTAVGPQPLVAAYRRRVRTTVTSLLDSGERRAMRLLDHLEIVVVPPDEWHGLDPDGRTAIDVDSPADLAGLGNPPDRSVGSGDRARRTRPVRVQRGSDLATDTVVVEEPLEIRAAGPGQEPMTVFTTLRTPGHDAELAVGWLYAEGLIGVGDVQRISVGDPLHLARPDDQLTVHLSQAIDPGAIAHRHALATASCGVCGRATIDELADRCDPVPRTAPHADPVPWSVLMGIPAAVRAAQTVFAATGGLHAAALTRADGRLVTLREDVGRHNALDAAIGAHVLAGEVPLHGLIGVLSGRAGFELVAKAAAAGIPILAAVGAPTDLAIRTAERLGVTLVGFLRHDRGNVYTHPDRLALDA